MSYTLVDYLLTFEELKEQKHYSAGVQATYLSVIMAFNGKGYPAELRMPIRDLMDKAGLNSTATVQECRRRLKNDGLIDFRKDRSGVSVYTLPTERYENNRRTRAERRANMTRTRLKDTSTLGLERGRDIEEERKEARANAGANQNDWSRYADVQVDNRGE